MQLVVLSAEGKTGFGFGEFIIGFEHKTSIPFFFLIFYPVARLLSMKQGFKNILGYKLILKYLNLQQ